MVPPLVSRGYNPASSIMLNRLVTQPSPSSFNPLLATTPSQLTIKSSSSLHSPNCPLYYGLTSSISSSSRKSPSTLLGSHQLNLFVLSQEHRFLSLAQTSPVYCLKYTGGPTIDTTTDHEHHTLRRPVLLHSSNPLCNPLLGNSITVSNRSPTHSENTPYY